MSHEDSSSGDVGIPTVEPIRVGRFLVVLVVAAVASAAVGIRARSQDNEDLKSWTAEQAVPTVALASLQRDDKVKEVTLPGDVEAFYKASIHGQASGYVREWRADIGAQVHKGDILAIVDTPELDERITSSEGELAKAKANLSLARVTAQRWAGLRGSSAVSQQAVDEKQSDADAKNAEVAAAQANLDRLRAVKAFSSIQAPFDGVVTARNIDVGSLVTDTASGGAPLFEVSDTHEMRIYVRAPESYASELKVGMKAKLRVPEYPDRMFDAVIATTSRSIDMKSRSLLVELMANNSEGLLSPGAFAEVRFQIPPNADELRAPASALLFRNQATYIATLDSDDRVKLNQVEIRRDYGSDVEVRGLPADARIVTSPPESISDGEQVRIANAGSGGGARAEKGGERQLAQSGSGKGE
jgi:RND family efflux transporter MFP subunit